jgi:hypothetical protein
MRPGTTSIPAAQTSAHAMQVVRCQTPSGRLIHASTSSRSLPRRSSSNRPAAPSAADRRSLNRSPQSGMLEGTGHIRGSLPGARKPRGRAAAAGDRARARACSRSGRCHRPNQQRPPLPPSRRRGVPAPTRCPSTFSPVRPPGHHVWHGAARRHQASSMSLRPAPEASSSNWSMVLIPRFSQPPGTLNFTRLEVQERAGTLDAQRFSLELPQVSLPARPPPRPAYTVRIFPVRFLPFCVCRRHVDEDYLRGSSTVRAPGFGRSQIVEARGRSQSSSSYAGLYECFGDVSITPAAGAALFLLPRRDRQLPEPVGHSLVANAITRREAPPRSKRLWESGCRIPEVRRIREPGQDP